MNQTLSSLVAAKMRLFIVCLHLSDTSKDRSGGGFRRHVVVWIQIEACPSGQHIKIHWEVQ